MMLCVELQCDIEIKQRDMHDGCWNDLVCVCIIKQPLSFSHVTRHNHPASMVHLLQSGMVHIHVGDETGK